MIMVVNVVGLALIGFIIYWFWLSKSKTQQVTESTIEVVVDDGAYLPSRIEVPLGRATTLRFIRKDPNPCTEKVILDDFNISADLVLDKKTDVIIKPEQSGEFSFHCEMQMYRGTIIVK